LSRCLSYSALRAGTPKMVYSRWSTSVKQMAVIAAYRSFLVCGDAGSRIDGPLPYFERRVGCPDRF
jgi:hypothetical protein